MNNSTKAISLVAVLALCCAALAGSAYAYSATYVDTIGEQPIENVYVTINDCTGDISYGVPGLDLDIEYNTLTMKVDGTPKTGYLVEAGTVNDRSGATNVSVDTDGNTVVFRAMIDKVTLQAYGDAAKGTLTVSDVAISADAFHTAGISIKYALVEGTDAPAESAYAAASAEVEVKSATISLATNAPKDVSLWIEITVTPLNEASAFVTLDEEDYYAPVEHFDIDKAIIFGTMNVKYVFEAVQATA